MKIEHIAPDLIPQEWGWMEPVLRPAIAVDPRRGTEKVLAQLMDGRLAAFWVEHIDATGLVVTQIWRPDFWIIYAAGQGQGGPKRRASAFREILARFEDIARRLDCRRMNIEGRNWSPILTDYRSARLPGGRFSFGKVL